MSRDDRQRPFSSRAPLVYRDAPPAGGPKPSEKQRNAAALLTHAWFGALIAWVNGTASTTQVRNELEAGAKLLLN